VTLQNGQQLIRCAADFKYSDLSGVVADENTQRLCIKPTVKLSQGHNHTQMYILGEKANFYKKKAHSLLSLTAATTTINNLTLPDVI